MKVSEMTIAAIKNLSPETLAARGVITAAKSGYICPHCGNGEGKDGTGIVPAMLGDAWTYHCFKCNSSGDNIDVLALHYGLDSRQDFNEICRRACDDFGINADFEPIHSAAESDKQSRATSTKEPDPAELERKAKKLELIRRDISEAQEHLNDLPVDARRGLSVQTLRHFGCGFLERWTSPTRIVEGEKLYYSRRLIIPTSPNHYLASAVDRNPDYPKSWKLHEGGKEIFNSTALTAEGVVVIVEGEIDAMSIWQATSGEVPVIALGGAAENKWTASLPKKAQFLIMFDNDDAGKKDSKTLREELIQRGYPAAVAFLSSGNDKIDANDILRSHGNNALAVKVKELLSVAQDDLQKAVAEIKWRQLQKTNPAAASIFGDFQRSNEADYFANEFELNRERRRQFSNRKTGFENIDAAQQFLPGLYILGGLPGIGKTSFAMQLAEQCAAAGENVLFISYEMDVDFLRAKSIARELYLRDPFATLTASRIASGDSNSAVEEIVSSRKKSARSFRLIRTNAVMSDLLAALEVQLSLFDKPPLIFIDYLQRIPVSGSERKDGVAKNVYALKDFQQAHNATIFLLSSLNRDNYNAPISFVSFKETGDIEYSADVIWGLQLHAVNGFSAGNAIHNRQMLKRSLKHQPREMELICVKNRFGNLYSCYFNYFSAHDHFTPYLREPEFEYHFSSDFNPAKGDNDTGNDSSELGGNGEYEGEVAQGGGGNWETLQDGTRAYSSSGRNTTTIIDNAADELFRANHPDFERRHPELYRKL